MKRILISLGGNALGTFYNDLLRSVNVIASPIAQLIKDGNEVVICHGNGPQVGYIKTSIDVGAMTKLTETMPLSECVAMSQGFIGYQLSNAIENELKKIGVKSEVPTVITRVLVDKEDPSFHNPTKPIGAFYTKEQSDEMAKNGKTMIEDSGRGYREVVASPMPLEIIEKKLIKEMIDRGECLIAGGGGGIPVIKKDDGLIAIDAVIDKDRTSVMLAAECECTHLVILTGVEQVAINFNTPEQKNLSRITIAEAEEYIKEGQFPAGSMLPKIESAIEFVKSGDNRETLITSLDKLVEGIRGEAGTIVCK
ncbi:MAG: carbamate kinase [Ezakiella sp.]|nr:carbamate kinase [Ezakiella sp.]MDD7762034.1 carbamate kinase [Bacillota bacterium]MDY3946956.1 carbamate kinase [Ezakiella sp.]